MLGLFLGLLVQLHTATVAWGELSSGNFDWDDNVMRMPTKDRIYKKGSSEFIEMTTGEFQKIRSQLGTPGPWENFELRFESFLEFRDVPGRNIFLDHVKEAVGRPFSEWQGPSWRAFVEALTTEESANWTSIITAREHSPVSMHEGLRYLQEAGYIKFIPKVEHIFPVNNPQFNGSGLNTSEAKVVAMRKLLDQLQMETEKRMQLMSFWGFSDDDPENVQKAILSLSDDIARHRWPNVTVRVYCSGIILEFGKPFWVDLKPNGDMAGALLKIRAHHQSLDCSSLLK